MKFRHSAAAMVAAAAGAVLLLAGCSSSGGTSGGSLGKLPDKDPTASITFLGPDDAKNLQPVIDEFEKAHPTIKVKYQSVPFVDLNTTISSRIQNGTGPDVYYADPSYVPWLAFHGLTMDLDSAFGDTEKEFFPAAWKGAGYDGKLWSLPMANSTQLLYYNKDLLAKAGITPPSSDPKNPITWQELAADALKAKQAGATYGLTFGQFDRYYELQPLTESIDGSSGLTGKDLLTPDVTNDAWVKAMTWYSGLFTSGASPRGSSAQAMEPDPDFAAGKSAFLVEGEWAMPTITKANLNYGAAALPMWEGGKIVTPDGGWGLAISSKSKNAEAAAVFLKFVTVDSGYQKYSPTQMTPGAQSGLDHFKNQPYFATDEGKKAYSIIEYNIANTAVNRPPSVGYVDFESIIDKAYADIRNGVDVTTALQSAEDQLKPVLAKYKG
jgi:ABC-type glycerol-3-phosphate transport system substrate-binding protein